ncbi:hypothetical protein [Lysinibacillus xylanilyticus]|uniref:Uncharacterized protein n=1 Tax=Lysinibacillus xylanilyticus TaxID=582475 RepID=A0A2M9Q751_9BACI|nr:hypothetical protein [Lysinibacillus xylanilyticus]PJO43906.1 hypothetical protein CWD94_09955 [Lysinibacillus xylanilyticus]
MSKNLNLISNEYGNITKRLLLNLKKLDINFNTLEFDDKEKEKDKVKDILIIADLKRKSYVGDEKFDYEVLFFPTEKSEVIRILSYLLKAKYNENIISKLSERIKFFNDTTMMGHLQLEVDEEAEYYTVSYRYGVTLRRDGDEMSVTELEHILFYLDFLVGNILDTVYGNENAKWI